MTDSTDEIQVLHVDDDPDFAELAAEFLEREDERISVQTAASADEGLKQLSNSSIDCIVSDYDMPKQNGIEFLETVREDYPDLPFILFTGKGSESVASEAISSGVSDYLQKKSGRQQYELLANRAGTLVEKYRNVQELDKLRRQFTILVDQNFVGIYIIQDGEFVYVNPRLAAIHGYDDPEEIFGMSPL
ncbi:response regulator, partial [Halodesulfurarchaeum sp.]|uniref:response regulator n=1 Tax=Halodesulfurarchaeum sp. TaxID=1980530 RepID=UPI002FC3AA5C